MPVLTYTLSSLDRFVKTVLSIRDRWQQANDAADADARNRGDEDAVNGPLQIWFRGQANSQWKLVPQLYRLKEPNENEIRTEYELRGMQLIPEGRVPKDSKEWYFLMQHFRAPTRLLDWTDAALIGLYFAVKGQNGHANSAVWMLDPDRLNAELMRKVDPNNYTSGVLLPDWSEISPWFPDPFEEPLLVGLPIAIGPPHVNRRLSVQRGRFTIHGKSKRGLDVIAARLPRVRLCKLLIPRDVGRKVLTDLSTCGIVETSVFPDLEGLAREVTTKWTRMKI